MVASPQKEGFGCSRAGSVTPTMGPHQQWFTVADIDAVAIVSNLIFRPDLRHFVSDHARVKTQLFNDIGHATKGPSSLALNRPLHGSCTFELAHGLVLQVFSSSHISGWWRKDAG